MKKVVTAALIAALASVSANATHTVTSTTGDYASSASAPNLITFDDDNGFNGFTLSGTGYGYNGGTRPSGDSTQNYLTVSGGSANLTNGTYYTSVAFYWGTPDAYNFIDLYDGSTLFDTIDASGIAGDSYVKITSTLAFDSVSFRSNSCCFELDNVSLTGAAASDVPEPTSWALMLLGFGSVGYAMRRRTAVAFTA